MPSRILVVDDDPDILEVVRGLLTAEGFIVSTASSPDSALKMIEAQRPDLAILDVMMETRNAGFDLCKTVAGEHGIPVIFLTARATDVDAIVGLGLGADDFVTKPFNPRVLAARVQTVLRRCEKKAVVAAPNEDARQWEIGGFSVDETRLTIETPAGQRALSRIEFLILRALAADIGKVLDRETIIEEVYGPDGEASERTVDSHVRRLRAKMNDIGNDPIETVRGVGYKLST